MSHSEAQRSAWTAATVLILSWTLAGLAVSAAAAAAARDDRIEALADSHRRWLEDVEVLISEEEREAFLSLAEDYQRDAFVERFWSARDPRPATARNEFKDRFYGRLDEARSRFRDRADDRFGIFLLHGEPRSVFATDCGAILWPLEIWDYPYLADGGAGITILFHQRFGGGPYKIWRPGEGYAGLIAIGGGPGQTTPDAARGRFYGWLDEHCAELSDEVRRLIDTFRAAEREGAAGPVRASQPPKIEDPEWLDTFRAFSTKVSADAAVLPATLEYAFAGRRQSRVGVAGRVEVPAAQAVASELAGRASYDFEVTGEVLLDDELFESFRYRFDLPVASTTGSLAMVFERFLRPGSYRIVVKVEDLHGGGLFRDESVVEVPSVADLTAAQEVGEPEAQPAEGGELILRAEGSEGLRAGYTRFTAEVTAVPAKVAFLLDGSPVMTKTRPPFSVELDLGAIPRLHEVRAVAYDEHDRIIAVDEVLMNPGRHAFHIRLVEPDAGTVLDGATRVRAEVSTPDGSRVERVEVYLGDHRVATLYQPPWTHTLALAAGEVSFLRAVAYLEDGNSTEDLLLVNAGGYQEDLDVTLVELTAGVVGADGRPIRDLEKADFRVLEDGRPSEILRFERLENLPIYAALLVDTSASMGEVLDEVRQVALAFFRATIEPADRAAVITFSEKPRLAVEFTSDLERVAAALAGIAPERSTALYDSVLFGLYYFQGVKGQRALVILSDGEDRQSEASFEETLAYARAAGVTIYAVGVELKKRAARHRLESLAEETGGRAFFIDAIEELAPVTEVIEADLRSRYLLVFQPSPDGGTGFRVVDVVVARSGAEVRTQRGYLP